jgi:hypothetical protein
MVKKLLKKSEINPYIPFWWYWNDPILIKIQSSKNNKF